MELPRIRTAIEQLDYGKKLPSAVYVWDQTGENLPSILKELVAELRRRLDLGDEFNILKFHTLQPKISFLAYPTFWKDAHPALEAAVVVDLASGKLRRDSYAGRENPPILHRKETFLPADHSERAAFARLSKAEEAAGLLEDTARIGFRTNWNNLLRTRGLEVRGHRLVTESGPTLSEPKQPPIVHRHLTAIARSEFSKPVKLLLELGQLRDPESLFDFGCGLGSDVRGLVQMGRHATGWDPVHAPNTPKTPAEVVNLGFVLNVIENPAERVEVLLSAWALTRRLLVIATLIRGQEGYSDFRCYGDGLLTSRNTFQKYFEPAELQALIEDSLEVEAVPVAVGIYFAFRNVADSQDFLSRRTRRFLDWDSLSHRLGLRRAFRQACDPYETNKGLLDAFWNRAVEMGRAPREDEFDKLPEVRAACGSVPKAMDLFFGRFGRETFDAARLRKREDVLVYLAASRLRKRVPFSKLSPQLQRDVKSFFGSHDQAERQALDAMFAAGDADELGLAVQNLGFGWWDAAEEQFTIHRSLLDDLPLIMRVYVECAARLFGNPREADLIKFHLRSRKLTFQLYQDFDQAPFPELKLRIKIDLPKLFVTVLDQRQAEGRQLLYFKERFVGPRHPGRKRMEVISCRLRALGFAPQTIGYGPSRDEFEQLLIDRGLSWSLTRRKKVIRAPEGRTIE